jgi:hypothetical protein
VPAGAVHRLRADRLGPAHRGRRLADGRDGGLAEELSLPADALDITRVVRDGGVAAPTE